MGVIHVCLNGFVLLVLFLLVCMSFYLLCIELKYAFLYSFDQLSFYMFFLCWFLQNPGFDFSQAQFSGNCPDPRSFMGGIRSD